MKWLFIIAVLVNIAFGVNNLFFVDKSDLKTASTDDFDKTQIVLLNEMDSNALRELQDKILPKQPDLAADLVKIDNETLDLDKNVSQAESETQAENLAETRSQELPPVDSDQVSQVIPTLPRSLCYRLGPFSKDLMTDVRLTLEAQYQNELSFGIETTSAITYYRIYIPPLKDKKAIKEILAQLDENGLKDHYVMSIDGRKNAIALGVFKKRSAAEKVATKAAGIGFSTTIEAISDDKNSLYQLMVLFKNKQDQAFYQTLVLEKELISIACENKG